MQIREKITDSERILPNVLENSSLLDKNSNSATFLPLFFLKETLEKFSSFFSSQDSLFIPSSSDLFQFGRFWSRIRPLFTEGLIHDLLQQREKEIKEQKLHWEPLIEKEMRLLYPFFYQNLKTSLKENKLIPIENGLGSTYLLKGKSENMSFIIKPVDEDILCLNNRKYYASPFNEKAFRAREEIPLYRSAQTDALAWEVAKCSGLSSITPFATMAIIESQTFYDFKENTKQGKESFLTLSSTLNKEKLCSVQEYIPNTQLLFEQLHEWMDAKWSETQIQEAIDQDDFEMANLFVWLTYDSDAHGANFLTYLQPNGKYGLKKIDNNLGFPETNKELNNTLAFLPNAEKKLSEHAKNLIAHLPLNTMIDRMHFYEMASCIEAFKERLQVLKILATRDDLSIGDIDMRLSLLELPSGQELALSLLPQEELEECILKAKESKEIENATY